MRHQRIVVDQPEIRTSAQAASILAGTFTGLHLEEIRIIHLDASQRMLKLARIGGGGRGEVAMPLREIMRDALRLNAMALIIAHNHPGGDPAPSRADKVATRSLVEAARPLRIEVLDHLIFAGECWFSFRAAGLV